MEKGRRDRGNGNPGPFHLGFQIGPKQPRRWVSAQRWNLAIQILWSHIRREGRFRAQRQHPFGQSVGLRLPVKNRCAKWEFETGKERSDDEEGHPGGLLTFIKKGDETGKAGHVKTTDQTNRGAAVEIFHDIVSAETAETFS